MYAGSRIRSLAKVFLVLMIILTIVVAAMSCRDKWGDFMFGSFLLVCIFGSMMSLISFYVIDAFGALVESSEMQAHTLTDILSEVKLLNKGSGNSQPTNQKIFSSETKEQVSTWLCPHCKKTNPISRGTCSCGKIRPL